MTTTTSQTLDIVRQHVGRRSRITRAEMRAILVSLEARGLSLANAYIRDTLGQQAPRAWERACHGITCISVDARGSLRDGQVRYDEPGSMHPQQHAELLFVAAAAAERRATLAYLRAHADRVLVVSGEPV